MFDGGGGGEGAGVGGNLKRWATWGILWREKSSASARLIKHDRYRATTSVHHYNHSKQQRQLRWVTPNSVTVAEWPTLMGSSLLSPETASKRYRHLLKMGYNGQASTCIPILDLMLAGVICIQGVIHSIYPL